MNRTPADLIQQAVASRQRPSRFTATLSSYDPVSRTARITTLAGSPDSAASPAVRVARHLERVETALKPGTVVVVEKLTGRTPYIVDVVNRPVDLGRTPLPGDHFDFGGVTTDIRFTAANPVPGNTTWTDGYITYLGQSFYVTSGQTTSAYICWNYGANNLFGQATAPNNPTTTWLVAHQTSTYVTVLPVRLHGAALQPASVPATAITVSALSDISTALGTISGTTILRGTVTISGATTTISGGTLVVGSGAVFQIWDSTSSSLKTAAWYTTTYSTPTGNQTLTLLRGT